MATELLLVWKKSPLLSIHDSVACRPMFESLKDGDLVLADHAYGTYMNISLLKPNRVEVVTRMLGQEKQS